MTVTRRQLLQLGGVGAIGLGLPELLAANTPRAARPKSCIFIVQYGGCSQIDSFDPKPDAPAELRGPFKSIQSAVPGTRLCERLPRLARMADKFALIRSMTHGNPGHDGGMHVAMTGHSQPVENTPYFGSVVAKLCLPAGNVPPYVWIQNLAGDVQPRYLTGGFLGARLFNRLWAGFAQPFDRSARQIIGIALRRSIGFGGRCRRNDCGFRSCAFALAFLGGGLVVEVAGDRVARVRGHGDHATRVQDRHGLLQQARLRVVRMQFEVLGHGFMQRRGARAP